MLRKFKILLFLNFSFVFGRVPINPPRSQLTHKPNSTISLKTDLGTLIGYRKDVLNKTINVFYGVPFAVPPVRELRFRRTKLIDSFPENPYEALDYKPHCIQTRSRKFHSNDTFSEDCLYMNIFTPDLHSQLRYQSFKKSCKTRFPVMIYLYGGVSSIYQMVPFVHQTNESMLAYSGDLIAHHDIIFVTLNFRQELFSSLYVENEFPANLASFDQSLAINWVKRHIKDYCGDEKKITLLGHSAGAYEVGVHILSKYSKHLFENAIMMSGGPLFSEYKPVTRNELLINSLLAINSLQCVNLTRSNITDQMNSLSVGAKTKFFDFDFERPVLKENYFWSELSKNHFDFTSKLGSADELARDGYIDREILEMAKFLSKNAVDFDCLTHVSASRVQSLPSSLISADWQIFYDFDFLDWKTYLEYKLFNKLNLNPKLNLLIGLVSGEDNVGILDFVEKYSVGKFYAPFIPKSDAKEIIKNLDYLKSREFDFGSQIADYYTDETKFDLSKGYVDSVINAMGDRLYYCRTYFFNYYAAMTANSVYSYMITHKATKHFSSDITQYDLNDYSWFGTTHADELHYLFGLPWRAPDLFTDLDRAFSSRLMKEWTSFAKNSKMSNLSNESEWPTSGKYGSKPRYVEINAMYTREREFEFQKSCEEVWRPVLELYKR